MTIFILFLLYFTSSFISVDFTENICYNEKKRAAPRCFERKDSKKMKAYKPESFGVMLDVTRNAVMSIPALFAALAIRDAREL